MAAEIRVDRITSRTGINTISFTGDGFSYLTNLGVGTTQPTSKLHIVGDTLITGVSTFNGDSNFSGNVTIGGTITYQDVKHIDAVGIITAQQGIQVLANGLNITGVSTFNDNVKLLDNDKILIGTGGDLEIFHDGSDSYLDNNTGALYIRNTADDQDIVLATDGGSGNVITYLRCDGSSGEVQLSYYGNQKLAVTNTGIDVTGTVGGDQLNISGIATVGTALSLADNVKAKFGDAGDLEIYHDSTNSIIEDVGTGNLMVKGANVQLNSDVVSIKNNANDENLALFNANGSVQLFYDNAEKLNTKSDGINVTGEVQGDSLDIDGNADILGVVTLHDNLNLQDNDVIYIGTGSDLQIYHDGSNSYISHDNVGSLIIDQNRTDGATFIRSDNGSGGITNYVQANGADGSVYLYHYGSEKLKTLSTGINVTGSVTCDGLTSEGDTTITNATGKLIIKDSDSTGSSAQQSISGHGSDDGEDWYVGQTSNSNPHLELVNRQTGDIRFGTSDNYRVYIDSNGHLNPYLDSNYDLGADAIRWRNVYADTLYGDGSNLTGIAAGGSGTFDTGISTSIIVPVTGGIGANDEQNRDVFTGPGIAYSFPSTASTQYVIESIHVVNKSGGNLYVSGRHDVNGGSNVPLANRVIVPYNGAVELLEQPHVANLSDIIRLQALTGTGSSATGANNGLDAFITYSTKSDSTDYIGVAQTITSTDQEFFEVASNPCVLQSLNLVNYSNNIDVDVSVSVFSGGTTGGIATTGIRRGYLAYNLTVPRNSTIELFDKPKRLESNQALLITASSNNQVGVVLSGKYITS